GLARRVFGGPPEDGDAGYSVTRNGDTYEVQAGSLFGVTEGATLLVYGSKPARLPALGSAQESALRPRRIVVTSSVTPSTAQAVAAGAPFDIEPGARARLERPGKAARLRVGVSPENTAIKTLLASPSSTLIEVVGEADASDLALLQRSDGSW